MEKVNPKRINKLNNFEPSSGAVVYWMSRDQRVNDNWALLYAQELAKENNQPLVVIFCLMSEFLEATIRQYSFMIKGLKEVEKSLKEKNIPFYLLIGNPAQKIPEFIKENKAGALVSDFDPLKIKRLWKKEILQKINIPLYDVDAHNICPCTFVSQKQEFAARTIRPKINRALIEFLTEFPTVKKQPESKYSSPPTDWDKVFNSLKVNTDVPPVKWIESGENGAKKVLEQFIENKLDDYDAKRNDPSLDAISNMSPYLHFGQISAQRIALEVSRANAKESSKDAYLEELIVRRELSDNFCYYNDDYDNYNGFPEWGKKTLNEHRKDIRAYIYSLEEFEQAKTHDELWNAAQLEMVKTGKMHGYMRMYWCKKILEWTNTPEDAIKISIYLNDKYELDGRDPNGYVGVAWSIGGVHDRAWFERDVFGKIRFMNYNGCKSKFNIQNYIDKNPNLQ